MKQPFALWLTGLPASGKSTLCAALAAELRRAGIDLAVLESDVLRRVLTPRPRYDEEERDVFYGALLHIGALLLQHGVPVLFDATANRRAYRERARSGLPRFAEIYVECPLEVCAARDPKGLYRGANPNLPGAGAVYEPPASPEIVVHSQKEPPQAAAERILAWLRERGWV